MPGSPVGPGGSHEHADESAVRATETTQGTQSAVVQAVVTARRGLNQRGSACPGTEGSLLRAGSAGRCPEEQALEPSWPSPGWREVWLVGRAERGHPEPGGLTGCRARTTWAHRPQKDKGQCRAAEMWQKINVT